MAGVAAIAVLQVAAALLVIALVNLRPLADLSDNWRLAIVATFIAALIFTGPMFGHLLGCTP